MKIFVILLLLTGTLLAQQAPTYHVKYVTTESIYLDAGSADSLAVGDKLAIKHADSTIATLEITYVAEHSSSCNVINSTQEIKVGDQAQITVKSNMPTQLKPSIDSAPVTETTPIATPPIAQPRQKRSAARIDGSVAVQLYRYTDRGPVHLNFTQPGLRFNFKASQLLGRDMTLTIRSDSRYDMRTRAYSSSVPRTQWRNRIYQFSLSYGGEQSPYNFAVGRIISNKFSGVGYIDGFLAQRRMPGGFRVGGFGGTQPQWQYSTFQTSLQKYGLYINYVAGSYQQKRFESTVAATGEYHGQMVSREFIFLSNSLNLGSAWNFYQGAEVDINRSWRKERTGQSFSMTNLYLSTRGRISKRLSVTLSYDNRKNYWTFETRSLADSLFDYVLRQGLRADFSIRAAQSLSLFTNLGYHKRATDSRATYSYGVGANKNNFLLQKQFLNLQMAGFSSPFTDGYNLSLTLGRYLWAGNMLSLGYGAYVYNFNAAGVSRLNQWIQTSGQFDITRTIYLSGTFEYDMGDDAKGERLLGEMGYRF